MNTLWKTTCLRPSPATTLSHVEAAHVKRFLRHLCELHSALFRHELGRYSADGPRQDSAPSMTQQKLHAFTPNRWHIFGSACAQVDAESASGNIRTSPQPARPPAPWMRRTWLLLAACLQGRPLSIFKIVFCVCVLHVSVCVCCVCVLCMSCLRQGYGLRLRRSSGPSGPPRRPSSWSWSATWRRGHSREPFPKSRRFAEAQR